MPAKLSRKQMDAMLKNGSKVVQKAKPAVKAVIKEKIKAHKVDPVISLRKEFKALSIAIQKIVVQPQIQVTVPTPEPAGRIKMLHVTIGERDAQNRLETAHIEVEYL